MDHDYNIDTEGIYAATSSSSSSSSSFCTLSPSTYGDLDYADADDTG
jgi:hypothetical protein